MQSKRAGEYAADNTEEYGALCGKPICTSPVSTQLLFYFCAGLGGGFGAGFYTAEITSIGNVIAAIAVVELLFRPVRDMVEKITVCRIGQRRARGRSHRQRSPISRGQRPPTRALPISPLRGVVSLRPNR